MGRPEGTNSHSLCASCRRNYNSGSSPTPGQKHAPEVWGGVTFDRIGTTRPDVGWRLARPAPSARLEPRLRSGARRDGLGPAGFPHALHPGAMARGLLWAAKSAFAVFSPPTSCTPNVRNRSHNQTAFSSLPACQGMGPWTHERGTQLNRHKQQR